MARGWTASSRRSAGTSSAAACSVRFRPQRTSCSRLRPAITGSACCGVATRSSTALTRRTAAWAPDSCSCATSATHAASSFRSSAASPGSTRLASTSSTSAVPCSPARPAPAPAVSSASARSADSAAHGRLPGATRGSNFCSRRAEDCQWRAILYSQRNPLPDSRRSRRMSVQPPAQPPPGPATPPGTPGRRGHRPVPAPAADGWAFGVLALAGDPGWLPPDDPPPDAAELAGCWPDPDCAPPDGDDAWLADLASGQLDELTAELAAARPPAAREAVGAGFTHRPAAAAIAAGQAGWTPEYVAPARARPAAGFAAGGPLDQCDAGVVLATFAAEAADA